MSFPYPILKIYIVPNVEQNKHKRKGKKKLTISSSWNFCTQLSDRYSSYRVDTGTLFTFQLSAGNYRDTIDSILRYRAHCFFVCSSNFPPFLTFGMGYVETNNPILVVCNELHHWIIKNLKKINTQNTPKIFFRFCCFFFPFFFPEIKPNYITKKLGLPPGSALFKVKARPYSIQLNQVGSSSGLARSSISR